MRLRNIAASLCCAFWFAAGIAGAAVLRDPIRGAIERGNIAIDVQPIAEGLTSPLGAVFPDDGSGRMFIYDQTGIVRIASGGKIQPEPLMDASARIVRLSPNYDERGLIGFALHPRFKDNHKVYTHTSEPVAGKADLRVRIDGALDHHQVIAEWTVSGNKVDPASRRELLRIEHPQSNHDGGAIQFGPDGFLYIGMGDGGAANDRGPGHSPGGNGQDRNVALGKMLRIDVDAKNSANGQYGIPAGNPFAKSGGPKEIWLIGLREPYFFSFDSATGKMYIGDVGQDNIEEVDVATSASAGANYGWRLKEGSFRFDPVSGNVLSGPAQTQEKLVDPIAQYDHDEGVSVIGGFVYRGKAIPALAGRYVFGDLGRVSTQLGRLLYLDEQNQIKEMRIGAEGRPLGMFIKGFAQDLEGEIYVLGSDEIGPSGRTGRIFKLVPAAGTK